MRSHLITITHQETKISSSIFAEVYIIGLVFLKTLGYDTTDCIFLIATVILSLCFLVGYCLRKWNKKNIGISCALLFLSGMTSFHSGRATALVEIMAILAMFCIQDSERMMKRIASIWLYVVLVKIILAVLGLIDKQAQIQWGVRGAIGVAYGFGFGNKNQFGIALVAAVISYIYLHYNEKKRIGLFILAGSGLFFANKYAVCTMAEVLIVLALFIYIVLGIYSSSFKRCSKFALPLCLIFSFGTSIAYGKWGWFNKLNTLLTTRVALGWRYLERFPISLFGDRVRVDNVMLDNGYLNIYCFFGIVYFFVFFYLYQKTILWMIKTNRMKNLFVTVIFLALGLVEGAFANPFMNYSILYIGEYLKDKDSVYKHNHSIK